MKTETIQCTVGLLSYNKGIQCKQSQSFQALSTFFGKQNTSIIQKPAKLWLWNVLCTPELLLKGFTLGQNQL